MKNIAVVVIALIISFGILYTMRPQNDQITVKPVNPPEHTLIKPGAGTGAVIIATGDDGVKLSQNTETEENIVGKYLHSYMEKSMAYSENNGTTVYYLPPRDYSIVSSAIMQVIKAYPEANKYYAIIGNPETGVKNMNYCPTYRTDPVAFANGCGNDLNFFEAYAFANFQTQFTMIMIINPVTTHAAYVLGNKVYDIFNTYNYQDYITRVLYKYNPTTAYLIIFDTKTISISPVVLRKNIHSAEVEATGIINKKPVTLIVKSGYYLIKWDTITMTRSGTVLTYNNATLNYYPVNTMKIEPIDPVIAVPTDINYIYINGKTYTIIPTMNLTDNSITIITYEVLKDTPVGNITVTYYN